MMVNIPTFYLLKCFFFDNFMRLMQIMQIDHLENLSKTVRILWWKHLKLSICAS